MEAVLGIQDGWLASLSLLYPWLYHHLRLRRCVCKVLMLNGILFLLPNLLMEHAIEPFLIVWSTISPIWIQRLWNAAFVWPMMTLMLILNPFWYSELYDYVNEHVKHQYLYQKKRLGFKLTIQSCLWTLAEYVFRFLIVTSLFAQLWLLQLLVTPSPILSVIYYSLIYSFQAFDYIWCQLNWKLADRVRYVQDHWLFFVLFGIPLSLAVHVLSDKMSLAVYNLCFPCLVMLAILSQTKRHHPLKLPTAPFLPFFWLPIRVINYSMRFTAWSTGLSKFQQDYFKR